MMPEVWMRGPIANIPALLQPVAHALLQAKNEVNEMMVDFPLNLLWDRPAKVASCGFHLQHMSGVLDRLFTYSKEQKLTEVQLAYLNEEGKATKTLSELIILFNVQVDRSVDDLASISVSSLTETRYLGRQMIPTTMIGLLFHAAEHTMRHTGQLYVTVQVLKANALL
jgi:uncharacterized damage-inducible protein DinB